MSQPTKMEMMLIIIITIGNQEFYKQTIKHFNNPDLKKIRSPLSFTNLKNICNRLQQS